MAKEKVYKFMSHVERLMRSNELENFVRPNLVDLEEKVFVERYELDDNGKAVKVKEIKTRKVADKFKDLNVNDFSIDNLTAIGAVGNLSFKQLIGDVDESTVNINKLMDRIDSEVSSASVESEKVSE